jgi:hypothetical protein
MEHKILGIEAKVAGVKTVWHTAPSGARYGFDETKEAIPVHGTVPPAAASWGTGTADPGQALAAVATLDSLARGMEAEQVGRLVDLTMARLMGQALANRPDPEALPARQASQRNQALADLDTIRTGLER